MSIHEDIEKVLISEDEIKAAVKRMGKQICEDYKDKNLYLVIILKGSVVFATDLMRELDIPCQIDFLAVSSYGKGTTTSGEVQVVKDLSCPLQDKDLLIVEDILDSGVTLSFLMKMLSARHPKSIAIATLLDKPERRKANVYPDYVGMQVPDEFIVGYGLDFAEQYRQLPYIGVLKPELYNN